MLQEYLKYPFVEIEVRLGTVSNRPNGGTIFDSCIDKLHFQKINTELLKVPWKSVMDTCTVEYCSSSKDSNGGSTGNITNTKLIESGGKKILMCKENIISKTIQLGNSPFDIKLSVNQELLLNNYIDSFSKEDCVIRDKMRKSFISDNFRYDLTFVVQSINNIKKEKYELEIELLQNEETITWTSEYSLEFLECKIYDLVNIIEPVDRKSFKLVIN